jgi:hypothetical protein
MGCNGAERVYPPSFDADQAAAAALAQFDADRNSVISREEAAAACQGIHHDWSEYDANTDGEISRDELAQRFQKWLDQDTGLMNVRCEVQLNGQPLVGAEIRLTPYPFLGDNFYPAAGATDRYGFAFLRVLPEEAPESLHGAYGVQVGLYRIAITHPTIALPAKYSTQSELSVDLSPVDGNTGIRFLLKP